MIYEGETVMIHTDAKLNNTTLTDADIDTVTVAIYTEAGTEVQESTAMTYSDTNSRWEYLWNTSGEQDGKYQAKIEATLGNGMVGIEWQTIRLASWPI